MTIPTKIDTTNLLTILGVIAAVWAIITPSSRLRFRFCMAWWDLLIIGLIFVLANYLVFAPALKQAGLYYSFGPWIWGLDSSSAVYLLFLLAASYLFLRLKSPTFVRGKITLFLELIESLHLTKKYDELVLLVEPQLDEIISLANGKPPLIVQWIDKLNDGSDLNALMNGEVPQKPNFLIKGLYGLLSPLRKKLLSNDDASKKAREVLLNILTSPDLTRHLSLAYPHFCLRLIGADEVVRSDFIDRFIDSLLDSPGSRLYIELKNNQNTCTGGRLAIPETNRLLHFFFADSMYASKSGIYRAIGESVCWRLDEDSKLSEILNKPLGSYREQSRFSCPINSGITMFEIMVHQGIHQRLQDHLWLHYFKHFAEKILYQMKVQSIDSIAEHQTPYHYLLCRLFGIAIDWAEQSSYIKTVNNSKEDSRYIPKEATKVLGSMLEHVIPSPKLKGYSKVSILQMVVTCYTRLEERQINDIGEALLIHTTTGEFNSTSLTYRRKLLSIFKRMDPYLQGNAKKFREKIELAIQIKLNR
ncbi:hypothetical protein AACM08_003297 [Escherichia coli]|nr:hypothetical protein [Escherichia coli]